MWILLTFGPKLKYIVITNFGLFGSPGFVFGCQLQVPIG